ncbi:P-loop containing nucleoside triphosphate hydrolase protein [Xylaria arbuscula]|nr:P-loop containing nucleoside triphosphate hydrolase protein [Xylaria arbuscula]
MLQHRSDLPSRASLDHLMEKVQILEAENKSFRKLRGRSIRIETLYIISESPGVTRTAFLDEPTWIIGPRGQAMLKAHYPIPDPKGYLSQQHDVAFVILKFYDSDEQRQEAADAHRNKQALPRPQPTSELIRLESSELVEAVEAFFAQQPNFAEDFPNFNINYPISAPYLFWYHYGSSTALDGLSASHADTMSVLTTWIDEHYGDIYNSVGDQLRRGVTTAETIEFLFKPGEVLVFGEKNDMVAAIASSWPEVMFKPSSKSISQDSTWKKGKGSTTDGAAIKWKWQVNTWRYHYDGNFQRKIRKATIVLQASSPTEEVPIIKLSPYPLKYASDKIRYKLQLRGETFWKCRFRRLVSYKDEKGLVGNGDRFMIDFETYEQLHSDSANFKDIYRKFEDKKSDPMDPEVMASDIPPGAPEIYVFPPKITGYNLRSKKWDDLTVDLIQDVVWNKKSFEHLVIDFETKELVQALVTNQIESEQGTDIIEQKGNGLIILLHGGPGTGKTFTAESVAEMAEKPLFRVTCGDIGTKPEVVEKYLESVLYLGKSWGCVVLLDEADVFLEQRTLTDLERNALVSVFLRVLEYYEGILILTSNRVGTFDEAFKSRIQLALHYQNLTESQRRKIWKNFFSRLKGLDADSLASASEKGLNDTRTKSLDPLDIDFDDIECYLTDLAKYELNGRQIRNAITTARQLAKFKKEKMSFHHLEHVITVSGKFDTYLQKVQEGFTDDQVARGGGIR